jgi:hypothetical protein
MEQHIGTWVVAGLIVLGCVAGVVFVVFSPFPDDDGPDF